MFIHGQEDGLRQFLMWPRRVDSEIHPLGKRIEVCCKVKNVGGEECWAAKYVGRWRMCGGEGCWEGRMLTGGAMLVPPRMDEGQRGQSQTGKTEMQLAFQTFDMLESMIGSMIGSRHILAKRRRNRSSLITAHLVAAKLVVHFRYTVQPQIGDSSIATSSLPTALSNNKYTDFRIDEDIAYLLSLISQFVIALRKTP
jgi:hypothetical protein